MNLVEDDFSQFLSLLEADHDLLGDVAKNLGELAARIEKIEARLKKPRTRRGNP